MSIYQVESSRIFAIITTIFIALLLGSQIVSIANSFIFLVVGVVVSLFVHNRLKPVLWTATIYVAGYIISHFVNGLIVNVAGVAGLSTEISIIVSRLSLIGYLLPLALLGLIYKLRTNYFRIGSFRSEIRFPLIWWGVRDPIWRNLLIATIVIGLSFCFFIDMNQPAFGQLLIHGSLFALINSILEELLWRGFILGRFVDAFGEKLGLVGSSIAFGFYHYSLGFELPLCCLFVVAGLFMGGLVIRSQGLMPVLILHVWMNILFSLSGVIF